jgi:microcystin-dependent protein
MGNPFIGEIRMFGGNFAPSGWSFCNGALVGVSQNEALFNLLGTTYGGDGQNTFGLPDLQGRVPVNQGQGGSLSNYVLGQRDGAETVTLTAQQLPSHTHTALGSATGAGVTSPSNATWGNSGVSNNSFGAAAAATGTMNPAALAMNSGGQAHDNMLPFLAISFIISLYGVFPSPN